MAPQGAMGTVEAPRKGIMLTLPLNSEQIGGLLPWEPFVLVQQSGDGCQADHPQIPYLRRSFLAMRFSLRIARTGSVHLEAGERFL